MAMSDELATLDATAQAELVRRKELTALELVEAAIVRIERVNPRLNAVVLRTYERARAEASRPIVCTISDTYHLLSDTLWVTFAAASLGSSPC